MVKKYYANGTFELFSAILPFLTFWKLSTTNGWAILEYCFRQDINALSEIAVAFSNKPYKLFSFQLNSMKPVFFSKLKTTLVTIWKSEDVSYIYSRFYLSNISFKASDEMKWANTSNKLQLTVGWQFSYWLSNCKRHTLHNISNRDYSNNHNALKVMKRANTLPNNVHFLQCGDHFLHLVATLWVIVEFTLKKSRTNNWILELFSWSKHRGHVRYFLSILTFAKPNRSWIILS